MKSGFSLLFTIFFSAVTFAQKQKPVILQWKLHPAETLSYTAVLDDEVEAALNKMTRSMYKNLSIDSSTLAKIRTDSLYNDTLYKKLITRNKIMEVFSQVQTENKKIVTLRKIKAGHIDIVMTSENKLIRPLGSASVSDTIENRALQDIDELASITKAIPPAIIMRGIINEDGLIQSFYTRELQKNTLGVLFTLPGRPVRVGDKWSVETHFISMDQSFICDSAIRKNAVTLTNLTSEAGKTIALIKYDIEEYVSGNLPMFASETTKLTRRVQYTATGDFCIEEGRWISYEGLLITQQTGARAMHSSQKISLSPELP